MLSLIHELFTDKIAFKFNGISLVTEANCWNDRAFCNEVLFIGL